LGVWCGGGPAFLKGGDDNVGGRRRLVGGGRFEKRREAAEEIAAYGEPFVIIKLAAALSSTTTRVKEIGNRIKITTARPEFFNASLSRNNSSTEVLSKGRGGFGLQKKGLLGGATETGSEPGAHGKRISPESGLFCPRSRQGENSLRRKKHWDRTGVTSKSHVNLNLL